jgi:hypothetical protein
MASAKREKLFLTRQPLPPYVGGGGSKQAVPASGAGGSGPAPLPRPTKGPVNFAFQVKYGGKPLEVKISFNGTRQEAYVRACHLATGLAALLRDRKFTVRVDRTDAAASGYEIGPDGHTIDT